MSSSPLNLISKLLFIHNSLSWVSPLVGLSQPTWIHDCSFSAVSTPFLVLFITLYCGFCSGYLSCYSVSSLKTSISVSSVLSPAPGTWSSGYSVCVFNGSWEIYYEVCIIWELVSALVSQTRNQDLQFDKGFFFFKLWVDIIISLCQSVCQVLYIFHLNCPINLRSRYYHTHFEDEESKAQGAGFTQDNTFNKQTHILPCSGSTLHPIPAIWTFKIKTNKCLFLKGHFIAILILDG